MFSRDKYPRLTEDEANKLNKAYRIFVDNFKPEKMLDCLVKQREVILTQEEALDIINAWLNNTERFLRAESKKMLLDNRRIVEPAAESLTRRLQLIGEEFKRFDKDTTPRNLSRIIDISFAWAYSIEGGTYWRNIFTYLGGEH